MKIPLEKLDDALMLWFTQESSKEKPVSGPILKEKAVQLHLKMGGDDDFKANEGWLNRWKKRNGIHMLTISGGKLSADFEAGTMFKKINSRLLLMKKVYLTISFIMWMKLVYILDCFHTKH